MKKRWSRFARAIRRPGRSARRSIYTQDELAVLTDFQKNWPDVAQAIDLQKRAEYQDLIKFTFESVASYLAPHLDQLKAIGNAVHLSEVKAEVPNYSPELEAQVMSWVENEPPYLQAAYKQVMQSGTSEEVADLFRRYQGATGVAPPVQQGAPSAYTGTKRSPKSMARWCNARSA